MFDAEIMYSLIVRIKDRLNDILPEVDRVHIAEYADAGEWAFALNDLASVLLESNENRLPLVRDDFKLAASLIRSLPKERYRSLCALLEKR